MAATKFTKVITVITAIVIIVGLQTSGQQTSGEPEKPRNLKVLPKNISHDELIQIMKGFSRALGVRCGECHMDIAGSPPEHPEFDFASDAKPEKNTARVMMKMVKTINEKYISKAGNGKFENVGCVTCHMGSTKPLVNIDSLPKK